MKLNPPCKDCTERHQACHGHCDLYTSIRIVGTTREDKEKQNDD